MAKRKISEVAAASVRASETKPTKKTKPAIPPKPQMQPKRAIADEEFFLQIVTGSYDRVLHGLIATVKPQGQASFVDTFLFTAHPSAIRCVALSAPSAPIPGQEQKVLLASGSTDPKINIYNISAHPPKRRDGDEMASAALRPILENSKNRELGAYNPHDSTVTKLVFPTRSKLISASEDSTIAVAKTRNWEPMSTIKAPIPKAQGRPSGDTAPLGGTPAGVNDFAVHPSMKLLISVSKGERCMRLWNLLTGKKAAVLNFSRSLLQDVGEGRHSSGEGRKVVWGAAVGGQDCEEFAVGFDRNIAVFGMDSLPRCRVLPDSRIKIHNFEYVAMSDESESSLIAVATEDGRIVICSTKDADLTQPEETADAKVKELPTAKLVAQIGGKEAGVTGRVKDFNIIKREETQGAVFYLVCGSSDGNIRLWKVSEKELKASETADKTVQLGSLVGSYDTNNRITCTAAFAMIPRPDDVVDSDEELMQELEKEDAAESDEEEA
ncbi:p21-activated protein kinase-interacting protein 1-like protein [Verticillium nonalfalfae]|uniref:p21-activated protein kinase-interacting protein 1-like protein n=1 Tax=Verticillium nonalfalfae TaxID=1051616 RepID=A0A3M9XXI2_9PEZI|nr:p21-activated protein kinase-interacting protein 1-like protein [Verticillium nonalfalfae]RNJ52615.1 p21-activated protein kinase-interacting protein 1-like protein [Verticillium nonalfalfae]